MDPSDGMSEHGPSIDWAAFAAHIQLELRRSNILVGELHHVLKVHRLTVSDAANGRQCSAEVYIALRFWMNMRTNRFFRLGSVAPNFLLFDAPAGGPEGAHGVAEPWSVSNVADCSTRPRVGSDQPALPSNAVRGIRGKPATIGGPSIDWTSFASTLRGRMNRFNISLRELQRSSGVHYSTLSRVANGACLSP